MDMRLDKIYFDYIKDKVKIYETRIFDEKRRKIKLLDVITFINRETGDTFQAMITELSYYKNFKDAIVDVGVKKVLPNAKSLNDAVKIYNSFPHSDTQTYKQAAKKQGVLRMKFELI